MLVDIGVCSIDSERQVYSTCKCIFCFAALHCMSVPLLPFLAVTPRSTFILGLSY